MFNWFKKKQTNSNLEILQSQLEMIESKNKVVAEATKEQEAKNKEAIAQVNKTKELERQLVAKQNELIGKVAKFEEVKKASVAIEQKLQQVEANALTKALEVAKVVDDTYAKFDALLNGYDSYASASISIEKPCEKSVEEAVEEVWEEPLQVSYEEDLPVIEDYWSEEPVEKLKNVNHYCETCGNELEKDNPECINCGHIQSSSTKSNIPIKIN